MSVTCGQAVMAAKLGFNLVWLGCLFCLGLLGILIHQFCRRKSAIRVIWLEDACLHVRTRCSAGPCRVDWTTRQKKNGQVRLTAGQSAYYVIRQNIRVETWRHWFPRHACTALYTSPGCAAEHNVLNLPHTQLRSRFSAAGSSGQSEAASSTGWAGLARADVRRFRYSCQSHAPDHRTWYGSLTTCLSFACFFGL